MDYIANAFMADNINSSTYNKTTIVNETKIDVSITTDSMDKWSQDSRKSVQALKGESWLHYLREEKKRERKKRGGGIGMPL